MEYCSIQIECVATRPIQLNKHIYTSTQYSTFIDCSSSFKSDRWAGNQWHEFQSEIVISCLQTHRNGLYVFITWLTEIYELRQFLFYYDLCVQTALCICLWTNRSFPFKSTYRNDFISIFSELISTFVSWFNWNTLKSMFFFLVDFVTWLVYKNTL